MKTENKKRILVAVLSVFSLCALIMLCFLHNRLTSWAFGLVFSSSGQAGHPYIQGVVEGEQGECSFLCINKGASAHNNYDYARVNADIDYSNGTKEQKELFWAYICGFGSYDHHASMDVYNRSISKEEARQVAWKELVPERVAYLASDGFMELDRIPPGCQSPENICELVSRYSSPSKAMSMSSLLAAPGIMDAGKLYRLCGLADFNTFRNYCTISSDDPNVAIVYSADGIHIYRANSNGTVLAGGGPVTVKVRYNPEIFKVVRVTGRLEYFKCSVPGSQQLVRAKGQQSIICPEFYLTTSAGAVPPVSGGTPSSGGSLSGGGEISYRVYEHQETFESTYPVELNKYDYETGKPLKDSTWQVLESFPDQDVFGDTEEGGTLREVNMRGQPTVWNDWLVFEDDMVTDEDGHISHSDYRSYEYHHTYCNGHPLPPEPEEEEDDEGGGNGDDEDDEEEDLMEEWQAQVDACESKASSSKGRFHHWECGSESEPSQTEAYKQSGCRADRDDAYENFINLRYAYTFRETDARDGYILHGMNGHPDDVPVEIITAASAEAGMDSQWTSCGNEHIRVVGYVRNMDYGGDEDNEDDEEEYSEEKALILTEEYELNLLQKANNLLCRFFGLEEESEENIYTIHLAAEQISLRDEEESERIEDEELFEASPSDAFYQFDQSRIELLQEEGTEERTVRNLEMKNDIPVGEAEDAGESEDTRLAAGRASQRVLHSFKVYDHRVPGRIHFNKRDLDLKASESQDYDSYADTQGDAMLEGAVYGLFAADDLYGPDTQRADDGSVKAGTGILFDKNDLIATAVTDKNGDGVFLKITEIPHTVYNYSAGQTEYSGKDSPKNLYDMDGYRKSYNEEQKGRIYLNYAAKNGNCWVGCPLLLGNYYIKELKRSEGYELSVSGKDREVTNTAEKNRLQYGQTEDSASHPIGTAWISKQLMYASSFPETNPVYGNRENLLEFRVKSCDVTKGFDVIVDGIPENADFYYDNTIINPVTVRVPVRWEWVDAEDDPLYETAQDDITPKRDQDGNPIPNPEARPEFPVPYTAYGYEVKKLQDTAEAEVENQELYQSSFNQETSNVNYVKSELEQMMRQVGIKTPKDDASGRWSEMTFPVWDEAENGRFGMPEITLELSDVTTNGSLIQGILDYFLAQKIFTYGSLQNLETEDEGEKEKTVTVTLAVGMNPRHEVLYETNEEGEVTAGYLFKLNPFTNRYLLRKYMGEGLVSSKVSGLRRLLQMSPDFVAGEDGVPENLVTYRTPSEQYLHYETGDELYDYWYETESGHWAGHEKIRRRVYRPVYEEQRMEEVGVSSSKVPVVKRREDIADPDGSTYVIYEAESGQYHLHAGAKDTDLNGKKESEFTIALADGSTIVSEEDIAKVGRNNAWGLKAGASIKNAEYMIRISGAGVGVSLAGEFHQDKSFIKNKTLVYGGNHDLKEDGNTANSPVQVLERIISEKVKVAKSIDPSTEHASDGINAAVKKIDNFRFKVYLKSNLERLYCDENGEIAWQNLNGEEQIIMDRTYPALAEKIYTKGFSDDGEQNGSYTALLERKNEQGECETAGANYNYSKFFDALSVVNNDKWDDNDPTYTSWRPIGNVFNRTKETLENTKVSDRVRQFAIDWYLENEIKERTHPVPNDPLETEAADGSTSYSDELYDRALFEAITKAEKYLKPFFLYDLDEIYAIQWDSAEHGGSDRNLTTLSADTLQGDEDEGGEGYYYAISGYLPYGTYVIVEQQPRYDALGDFRNKHYRIDDPKEVEIPSVYADYEGSQASPEILNPYYNDEGKYSPALVPWSIVASENAKAEQEDSVTTADGESSYKGFAYVKFQNKLQIVKLRIENLDAATYENILHDDAQFSIYTAKRNEKLDGDGSVLFYEEDTMITGTKEFLTSMGAQNIRPLVRRMSWIDKLTGMEYGPGNLYSGVVSAGTPMCEESERREILENSLQSTGYFESARPFEAGAYVICETKPSSGYVRSKPIALEIYSDKITYYKDGDRDKRVLAACYFYEPGDDDGGKRRDLECTARINVVNQLIELGVDKQKESSLNTANTTADKTVTYKVSGRIDGTMTEIGNQPDYEYAYDNGQYLGYAWKKGTLEYLNARKQAGEQVELVSEGAVFAGYGYVTRRLETAGDESPYVTGAAMTLFEALELTASGDTEDHAYEQLVVERNERGNVTRMYVKDDSAETGGFTDILYYDLDKLSVTETKQVDGQLLLYGYDRNHNKVSILQIESDRHNIQRTDTDHSLFAFKGGVPYLELTGGDFTKIDYNETDKIMTVETGTKVYHLDRNGNRDALVDPYTGMAYVEAEEAAENGRAKVMVWPVRIQKDKYGNVVSKDKITTSREAALEENREGGYITGSWKSDTGEKSHLKISRNALESEGEKKSLNGEQLKDDHNGRFEKCVNPVCDKYGLTKFYQQSGERYCSSTAVYDRNGDFIRLQDPDQLEEYRRASWSMSGQLLMHRLGEGYIQDNTWISGDISPNDPFRDEILKGGTDILKRVPSGSYIMEESESPSGYQKGMPVAVSVKEIPERQTVSMVDRTIKVEISKIDRSESELKGVSSFAPVQGAELALYEAERVYTADSGGNPDGYYLKKKGPQPLKTFITGKVPVYLERISAGDYLLEEVRAPAGFVTGKPIEIEVKDVPEVQTFVMEEDHTKIEIEKYTIDGSEKKLLAGAEFTLYDENHQTAAAQWTTGNSSFYAEFAEAFEKMYREHGAEAGTSVVWGEQSEYSAECVGMETSDGSALLFRAEDQRFIRILIYGEMNSLGGKDFTYEYQFDWKSISSVNPRAVCYQTIEGKTRLEYLPCGETYILEETKVPYGYAKTSPTRITAADTSEVQQYGIENVEGTLRISKTAHGCKGELAGARLGLFRPDENGGFIRDEENLLVEWVSGEDGIYTELDQVNHRIPQGYAPGDLKPHTIRRLPDGIYWLAELESPDYYAEFSPVRVEYRQQDEVRMVQVEDVLVTGTLKIQKTDPAGQPLTGAVFELSANTPDNGQTQVFSKILYGLTDDITVDQLPVGSVQENGKILPYEYRLREIVPPAGYAVNKEAIRWKFAPDHQGVSYKPEEKAEHQIEIRNEKTRITIGKNNFEGAAVMGAELAVYEILGRDESDKILYEEESPFAVWRTEQEEERLEGHVLEGMTAGCSYLIKELYVPDGYRQTLPMIFTVSPDGHGISNISNQMNTIAVGYAEGRVSSVTIRGRYAVKTDYREETDEEWETDQPSEITETTKYSDGTILTTGHWVIGPPRNEELISVRAVSDTILSLEMPDGTIIDTFSPDSDMSEKVISNKGGQLKNECLLILREYTKYSDGTSVESDRLSVRLGKKESVDRIIVSDRPTDICFSKIDVEKQETLPGCEMILLDSDGDEVINWVSGTEQYQLKGMLKTGQSYVLREEYPAEGYACAAEIPFTVSEAGITDVIIMQDEEVKPPEQEKPEILPTDTDDEISPDPSVPISIEIPAIRKVGKITASYIPGRRMTAGWVYFDKEGHPHLRLPLTGRESNTVLLLILLFSAGLGIFLIRKNDS